MFKFLKKRKEHLNETVQEESVCLDTGKKYVIYFGCEHEDKQAYSDTCLKCGLCGRQFNREGILIKEA